MPRRLRPWAAGLVYRAYGDGAAAAGAAELPRLAEWPVDWVAMVNAQSLAEEGALRVSIRRGRPFGSEGYQIWTREVLGLESTCRQRGRPRKLREDDGEKDS